MIFLVKVKNTDDEIIAGLLEYGTVDDILMDNICIVNANKNYKGKIESCYGVLNVEEDENFNTLEINLKGENTMNDTEERFLLDEDSICYGCQYYSDDGGCDTTQPCIEGDMNGYRMDG